MQETNEKLPTILKIGLISVIILAILILVVFSALFHNALATQETFAQFGDFVGGTLNPILGFATIGLLVWSVQIQLSELRLTRQELKASRIEAANSATALAEQVKLAQKDFKMKEITRALNEHIRMYDEHINSRSFDLAQEFFYLYPIKGHPETINYILNLIESDSGTRHEEDLNKLREQVCIKLKEGTAPYWPKSVELLLRISQLVKHYADESRVSEQRISFIAFTYFLQVNEWACSLQKLIEDKDLQYIIDEANLYMNESQPLSNPS
ncbi:hypothetical protein LMH66_17730 [Shewanella sp. 10N.7]|uniref:hypothetical protein n=1 Tax=Shewanella sp. 10N.7 TaxID=2885093 RepID=UPI001E36E6CA|nr:hypothetical protein [Shewanella sp. 10N.7]MCC4834490.1 hypothetical protein [Shewanella sp. 10N.7]